MGLVSTTTTPMLLKLVAQQQAAPPRSSPPTTSRFDQMMDAYDTFGRAAETKALKVVIKR